MRRRSAAILPAVLAAGWLLSLFAPLLSPAPGAGEPRHPALPSPAARGVPGARGVRAADLEPLAARRPAAALEPQLRGVLSAELAGLRGPAALCAQPARPPARRDRLRRRLAAGAAPGRRRAGRRRSPAVGYVGCGAYLSLLSAFTLFCSMAWFPWVLLWADRALRAPADEAERLVAAGAPRRRRPRRSSSSTASRRRW